MSEGTINDPERWPLNGRVVGVFCIAICLINGKCVVNLYAQAPTSTKDGIYTADQAKRGDALYAKNCASCHGAKYEGRNQAPPLAGAEFVMNWDGQPLSDLLEKMQTSMPGDKPGSLSAKENADILAAMLRENEMPAGAAELSSDAANLKAIKFAAGK